MCGITGYIDKKKEADALLINRMLTRIHHRGPDECGVYINKNVGLGSVRLSIIDITSGQQPLPNEDLSLWITFNGEIYNYIELKADLETKGHIFRTQSDTEVLLHLFEEYGENCLSKLNGQFAFSIWNKNKKELFLARDRIGIRPLFYYYTPSLFVFASEVKAIFEHPEVPREISPEGLAETFTFWTTISPNTVFRDVKECPPGHYIKVSDNNIEIKQYWQLRFSSKDNYYQGDINTAKQEFNDLFYNAVRIRLRADVPVAAYLSGGIDSSVTTSYIKKIKPNSLKTFSIGFDDAEFDETAYQEIASKFFNTNHYTSKCTSKEIASNIPKVVWHSEIPILRTSPSPMFSLSKLVRQNSIKVVITGEGADELLGGYNIFKETIIRHFWAKNPNSKIRPLLLRRLYPYIPSLRNVNSNALRLFFAYKLKETDSPIYSHLLRWKNSSNITNHFSEHYKKSLHSFDPYSNIQQQLNGNINELDPLAKAQSIEIKTFLSGYLLSSQGDRMGMANSVEGRYPFLDHRIIEFCATLPPEFKLNGLNEKFLLKSLIAGKIPEQIVKRSKQAYRAPIHDCFFGHDAPDYVREILGIKAIEEANIFNPVTVSILYKKMAAGKAYSEINNMAITAIITAQLLHNLFIRDFKYLQKSEVINFTIRDESNYKKLTVCQ